MRKHLRVGNRVQLSGWRGTVIDAREIAYRRRYQVQWDNQCIDKDPGDPKPIAGWYTVDALRNITLEGVYDEWHSDPVLGATGELH